MAGQKGSIGDCRREGWFLPSGKPEVATATNLGGNQEASALTSGVKFSRIRKRSYKRALRRAQLHGTTMYRGRRLISDGPILPVQPDEASVKPRIRFVSWNVGGLSDILFTELKQWLQQEGQKDISIIILQETHWDTTMDWSTSEWHFCHSATGRKGSGGILVGIRAHLSDSSSIRWQEAEPGRILQVRCFLEKQQIDVVGVYQHAYLQKAGQTESVFTHRRRLLNKLDALLASLPARSHIVLAGDFNTAVVREPKVSGFGLLHKELGDKEAEDQQQLLQVLKRHRLSTLNTWGKKSQAATYVHAKGESQIDFVCVRQSVADGQAKLTRPIKTTMAGWRTTGHLPLVGTVPFKWTPWTLKPRRSEPTRGVSTQKLLSIQQSDAPPKISELRDAVQLAGGQRPEVPVRPEPTSVEVDVAACWRLRRKLNVQASLLGYGFVFVFRYFKTKLQYLKAHRLLKKALRARKRRRTLELLCQAEDAAQRNDVRGVYGVVRLLCPSRHSQKIRLRDAKGNLMNGESECKVLAKYAAALFGAASTEPFQLQRIPYEVLSLDKWSSAWRKLKAEKAAPNQTPPLRNWKQHGELIVPQVHRIACQMLCCDNPSIPEDWTVVQLAWLAKPKKCPCKPENLRSVGLMAGDTKMFMMVLKEAMQAELMQGLWDIPQFAYRPQSSTIDALLRGSEHKCLRQAATGALPELCGGVMISLDLSKAFDYLPFHEMYAGLRSINVPDNLARLIVEVHRQSRCVVRHGGTEISVTMKRGLRQGCPLAPSVYSSWTILLCRTLGISWCNEHTSFFADDVHGHWEISTVAEFMEARKHILRIVELLHRAGMSINFDKSVAVLTLRGREAKSLKSRYLKWQGNKQVLWIGTDPNTGRDVYLPVQDQMEYLGAVLSYGSMEAQTVQVRAAKAWANFAKLRPMLRTASDFSLKQRLRMFRACVVTALLYGIVGVGVSSASLRTVVSTLARMLRKLLRVYQHGVTNEEVLHRAEIQPSDILRNMIAAKARTLEQSTMQSPTLSQRATARLQDVLQELDRISSLQSSGLVEVAHYTASHAEIHLHCRLKLAAAEGMSIDALMEQVKADEVTSPPVPPTATVQQAHTPGDIERELLECGDKDLPHHSALIRQYDKKCILCSQQVKATGSIKKHWQTTHGEAWKLVQSDAESAARSLKATFRRPCQHCGSMAKYGSSDSNNHATRCSPFFQVLAARCLWRRNILGVHLHGTRGPALKQHEKERQYRVLERTGIHAQLCSAVPQSGDEEATREIARSGASSTEMVVQSSPAQVTEGAVVPSAGSSAVAQPHTVATIRLRNPHQLCYVNASILAMLHAHGYLTMPRLLEQVYSVIRQVRSGELTLSAHFGLRHVFQGWPLDPRQRDAAEFTDFLLRKAGYAYVAWEARINVRGVRQVTDSGSGIIFLDLPNGATDIQELMSAWSGLAQTHALIWAQETVIVQLGRFPQRGKSRAQAFYIMDRRHMQDTIARSSETVAAGSLLTMEWRRWLANRAEALDKDRAPKFSRPEGKRERAKIRRLLLAPMRLTLMRHQRAIRAKAATQTSSNGEAEVAQARAKASETAAEDPDIREAAMEGAMAMGDDVRGDAVNLWRAESSFVLFVRAGIPGSLVPALFAAKSEWQKLRETNPEQVKRPLRSVLFSCLVKEMHDRLQTLKEDEQRRASMIKLGWLKENSFQKLRWDAKLKKRVVDEEGPTLLYDDAMAILQEMMTKCSTVEALLRFRPTRPITDQMPEGTVAFLLQFSLQNERGLQMYADMSQLCQCGVLGTVGATSVRGFDARLCLGEYYMQLPIHCLMLSLEHADVRYFLSSVSWSAERRALFVTVFQLATSECSCASSWAGLHRYFGLTQKDRLPEAKPGTIAQEPDDDVVMAISSESECEVLQPNKIQRCIGPPCVLTSVYAADGMLLRECLQNQQYLVPSIPVDLSPDAHGAEVLAAQCLRAGKVPWKVLADIMDALPGDGKLRWDQQDQGVMPAKSFMTGAYARGPY
ncbi:unnamed protein product [Symbiodinium sp. CCMP2592]|nr:unnamed protein product [Symbiodinium sp. CCMP2592]